MCASFKPPQHLAPLQLAMLKTSGHDHHVEQADVVFSPSVTVKKVAAAWAETVALTEALRLQFLKNDSAWHAIPHSQVFHELSVKTPVPESWETWLAADRARPLLTPESMPWRAAYWPAARRFIWTFHHALLDGRSITRILKSFFERIEGRNPGTLSLSRWQPASVGTDFLNEFPTISKQALKFSSDQDLPGPAVCYLGQTFLKRLESFAKRMGVTVPTLITWSWGQAIVREKGLSQFVVEQLRAGPPQRGTAGFLMNTLPVQITKAFRGEVLEDLQGFAKQLRELRKFENVSLEVVYQGSSFENSVIMVEHRTMAQALAGPVIVSFKLHEAKGEALGATAHILPDLRLEVEGPERHGLLRTWIEMLKDQMA